MGGGSPRHSNNEKEDSPRFGLRHGNQSPWPPSDSCVGVEDLQLESFATEDVLPTDLVSALAVGDMFATYESPGPGISLTVDSEPIESCLDALQSGEFAAYSKDPLDGREINQVAASEILAAEPKSLNHHQARVSARKRKNMIDTCAEETVHDFRVSEKESTNLQKTSASTPSTAFTSQGSVSKLLHPVCKRIFKLIQIQNDNQDLSFVEKVILSRDEVFSLCNNIAAGSGNSSKGRGMIIDFGSLNSKSLKVIGFFGSKDVMREIFLSTELTEQTDIWMQMKDDTLAPGLYAWLDCNFVFVFYWHDGQSLSKANRKDMSCNFIRYVFDLCDTVCVCVEGKNLKDCLLDHESAPRFSKRQRTQRLQISRVKASEDSVKVTDGFVLKDLSLGGGKALPAESSSLKNPSSSNVVSECDYKLSKGLSRVALLVSSKRPRKLSSSKVKETMNVNDVPAFIKKWTVDCHYRLDLKGLSDSDFIAFIRSAKLTQAEHYNRLVDRNNTRKEEEKRKFYNVDELVEEEQEHLRCYLEAFMDAFFKSKYPWEENSVLLNCSAHLPRTPEERSTSSSEAVPFCQQSQQPASYFLRSKSSLNIPAITLNRIESEVLAVRPDEAQEITQDRLNQLENAIHNLLQGKDSKKRIVFPTTGVYAFDESSEQYQLKGNRLFVFREAGPESFTSKFGPIFYGSTVIMRSVKNIPVRTTGTIHRYNIRDHQGPLLTDEDVIFTVKSSGKTLRMRLEPACPTGDLSAWLNQQAAEMEFPRGWKHAALLTGICQKLAESGCENDLTEDLARKTLTSEFPLLLLQKVLPQKVLEFAQGKWEELGHLQAPNPAEMPHIAIRVRDLYAVMYKELRHNFQTRIFAQTRRFSTSLLNQKIRKQGSESYERLEVTLKEEEVAFLASQKEVLSRRTDGTGPLTLTIETCKLIDRSGGWVPAQLFALFEGGQKISFNLIRQEFDKESIAWHGMELAPMKKDLDQLIVDNEHVFSPTCSARKEIIDLDPSIQTMLKVVFLQAGQLLVFVVEGHGDDSKDLLIYLCPKLGVKLCDANCIRKMRRGFDLISYDERSRFIALYDSSISTIKTYRFDETFRHMDWTGVDISLGEYSIGHLIWMDFVTGKNEIVFIDDLHRVRLCEVSQPGMVRPGNVHIGHGPIVKACVMTQGSCLLLLRTVKSVEQGLIGQRETPFAAESGSHGESEDPEIEVGLDSVHPSADRWNSLDGIQELMDIEEQNLALDVYKLDDRIHHFSSIPLDMKIKDSSKLVVDIVSFSSQMHLVIFDSELPSMLSSKVIKISSASEVCQLQQVTQRHEEVDTHKNPGATQPGPVLDYIYQIFEKYATSPALCEQSRDLQLRVVLKGGVGGTYSSASLSDRCVEYVKISLDRLKIEKGKDLSALNIHISVHDADRSQSFMDRQWSSPHEGSPGAPSAGVVVKMGAWMRRLVCLVPIQIARAEHNALKPMIDGLQLTGTVDYVDAISLANVMRFGLYEAVFDSWTGPVKVVSSMDKQSSGKSYLLNHLSGSLLDVAGGRCTDGVWMTLREGDGCLYVLLDFEGLGSFERSEQEDMLLSMLNAAISNLTIFNKKDFHLDKETEAIFERFQNGVSLVKTDAKLFRGLFYLAIKDVDISDVEDLKKEFFSKISQICNKSQDNFLTRMYGGSVEISAMPSFNRPEFHESIADIARTVEELEASYLSGRKFLLDLKLIIAQISTKDWSPIDSKGVALRINLLRKHLQSAISVGCFFSDGLSKPLMQFDNQVEIADEPLVVDEIDFRICDTALELTAFKENKVAGDILRRLMATFKSIISRKGEKDEEWHSFFEKFITALVLRRKKRALDWITSNTSDFSNDGDIQKLQLEAIALLAEVQQNLLLCSCKCERCFLRCVQEKGHPSSHSCMGDHRCAAMCTYCLDEESALGAGPCNDAAGHDGPHDCQEKSHTCGRCCTYAGTSSNCNGNCSKKSGHAGDHQCNSRQHTCNQICSLPSCKNPCVSPIDVGDHKIHACHEKFCPIRCTMMGCNRTCATEDHFHGINSAGTQHFCGSEHPCSAKCEYQGNCEVLTEVSKKTQTFTGRRATFDYVLVSEQNGHRKGCCIVVPPFKDSHEGPHSHSSNPDAVHFCETRCPSCGYFCNRPMGHGGLHSTTHGNMRDVNFVAESEEIDILDRKYAWGESGVAEMCQMHCKAQGRGHIHLIHCPANKAGGTCRKLFDSAQHEMRKYGPDFEVPKDEMTHAAFWEYMRFEDPCSAEEQKQFALCNHQCKSDEHNPTGAGAITSAAQNISYCTESLWHKPILKTDLVQFGTGYITEDGHHFSCDHSTNVAVNVIFIIDRSSSMDAGDITPSMTRFSSCHDNRLGCVYEAILRFIRTRFSSLQEDIASVILFNHDASTVFSLQEMKESLVDNLLPHYACGSTTYSSGLQKAEQILSLASKDARLSRKSPVIIFLSDGGNNGGSDPLYIIGAMKALDPKLQLHTIMFGNDPARKILEDMANAGDGTFEVSLDEVQLCRRFEGLAKSLRPQVASLL